jgi:hypothetical protein
MSRTLTMTLTGEMGYFRIIMGKNALGIESEVAWATPGEFTVHNAPCYEDGSNCQVRGEGPPRMYTMKYMDPSEAPHLFFPKLYKAGEGVVNKVTLSDANDLTEE